MEKQRQNAAPQYEVFASAAVKIQLLPRRPIKITSP
jgi:hypothetical protein